MVILYGGDLTRHAFEKVFDGKSAFDRVLGWASVFGEKTILLSKSNSPVSAEISSVIGPMRNVELVERDFWSKADLIGRISESIKKNSADCAVISYADTPFLSEGLTRELLDMHGRYAAEYSFADGFPYGLCPEILDGGTASILSELSRTSLGDEGGRPVDREAVFSVLRGDINSFEIETLISDEDYRLLRLSFESSSRINFLACRNLFGEAVRRNVSLSDAYALSDLAAGTASVLATVPAFYNIQISSRYNHACAYSLESVGKSPAPKDFMDIGDFRKILSQIRDFSGDAVISLSAFGEPLLNPDFLDFAAEVISANDVEHRIPLMIETDGLLVTEELSQRVSALASERKAEVNWIVSVDAAEKSMYARLHNCGEEDFERALSSVSVLERDFPGHVYPQFVRMRDNESQLEAFYRFWKERGSPSRGELIIQKYNSVCGALPDLKSADLSPVGRLPCWHLRRDMTVLCDGSVPVCFQLSFPEGAGNILSDGIERVWGRISDALSGHIECGELSGICRRSGTGRSLPAHCGSCDESYTFNF